MQEFIIESFKAMPYWFWILVGIALFSAIGLFILEYLNDKDFQKWRESVDKRLNKLTKG